MTTSPVTLAIQYFPLTEVGAPAGGGSLYIGDADTDPTVVGNQKTIYALPEDGIQVQISQPVTLSGGGQPLYNGSPVSIYTDGDFSLTVLDINGAQVYYVPSTPGFDLTGNISVAGDISAGGELSGATLDITGNADIGGDLTVVGDITGDNIIGNTLTIDEFPDNQNLAQFDGADGLEDSGEAIADVGIINVSKEWTKQQGFDEEALTSSGNAVAWNLDDAQTAVHVLTENTTISAPTNMKAGSTYALRVVQAAGVYTLAFNAVFEWGAADTPVAPAANGDVVVFTFYCDGVNMLGGEFVRVEA